MARVCQNCGKRVVFGRRVSHSHVRTSRVFKPNLQKVWVQLGGKKQRKTLCTKCLRKFRKETKELAKVKQVEETVSLDYARDKQAGQA